MRSVPAAYFKIHGSPGRAFLLILVGLTAFNPLRVSAQLVRRPPKLTLPGDNEPLPPSSTLPEPAPGHVEFARKLRESLKELRRLQQQARFLETAAADEAAAYEVRRDEHQRLLEQTTAEAEEERIELEHIEARVASLSQSVAAAGDCLSAMGELLLGEIKRSQFEAASLPRLEGKELPVPNLSVSGAPASEILAELSRIHKEILQSGNLVEPGEKKINAIGGKVSADAFRFGNLAVYCVTKDGEIVVSGGGAGSGDSRRFRDNKGAVRKAVSVLTRRIPPEIVNLPVPAGLLVSSPASGKSRKNTLRERGGNFHSAEAGEPNRLLESNDAAVDENDRITTADEAEDTRQRNGSSETQAISVTGGVNRGAGIGETAGDAAASPLLSDTASTLMAVTVARLAVAKKGLEKLSAELRVERSRRGETLRRLRGELDAVERKKRKLALRIKKLESRRAILEDKFRAEADELTKLFTAAVSAATDFEKTARGSIWELSASREVKDACEAAERIVSFYPASRRSLDISIPSRARLDNFRQDLELLFDGMRLQRRATWTVETFRAEIVLPDGAFREISTLRVGNIAAFALLPNGEGACLVRDPDSGAWKAAAGVLDKRQRSAVAALVKDPLAGGVLPVDVTGGVALRVASAERSLPEWFSAGGPLMYAILLVAVLALLLGVERLLVLSRAVSRAGLVEKKVFAVLESSGTEAAMLASETAAGGALSRVLRRGLAAADSPREQIETVLQEAIAAETPGIRRFVNTLGILAALAPLLGLLGTVTGMINTFRVLTVTGGADPRLLSGGISEALITTQAGLLVAVPVIILHAFVRHGGKRLSDAIYLSAVALVNRLVAGRPTDKSKLRAVSDESSPEADAGEDKGGAVAESSGSGGGN